MLLLGIDIGTSSIKFCVVDASSQKIITSFSHPSQEMEIISPQPGWAEQSPDRWWQYVLEGIQKGNASGKYESKKIGAIGIAYQMHGLVMVDQKQNSIYNSIIWCDSRAVQHGENAFKKLGKENCLCCLLNSPGNFTAAKLAWIKENEPQVYNKIDKIMLPGDFIAMKLTGEITTTIAALSEGIFWDFKKNEISEEIIDHFGFDKKIFPPVQNVFSEHGRLKKDVAKLLGFTENIPVTYKAGDQPNTAFSLNVMQPGEVAANAGTSGVIYAVTDHLAYDAESRINSFAHVNYTQHEKRIGVLLCINGAGIANSWVKKICGNKSFSELNAAAASVPQGSDGLLFIPFGNGSERLLKNKLPGAQIHGIDFNKHSDVHIYRAAQEGVAFAFRYGFEIMKACKLSPTVIRAGYTNMFLSDVFVKAFADLMNIPVELFDTDGSVGAAFGAGMGAKQYSIENAFKKLQPIKRIEPANTSVYDNLYKKWKEKLDAQLKTDQTIQV